MLLKEQALKRIKSHQQKKEHRRTKSLDDDSWEAENNTGGGGGGGGSHHHQHHHKNDKITEKDKEKVRSNSTVSNDDPSAPDHATTTAVTASASATSSSSSSSSWSPQPSTGPAASPTAAEGPSVGRESGRTYLNLAAWLDRDREGKDKEKDKEKDKDKEKEKDKSEKGEGFLAGYARLKQHYAAKLQMQLQSMEPVNHQVDDQTELEWNSTAAAEDAGFTYYDLSPSSKMEGIVSKGLKTKFAPYFFEVHTGCIIYDRIHFKGSIPLRGGEHLLEIKHSQGPLPRVLFEQTEGHIFWIQYREDDTPPPTLGISPAGLDRRDALLLSLAASSRDEMMDWVKCMRGSVKEGKRKKRSKEKTKSRNSLEHDSTIFGLDNMEKVDKANGIDIEDSQETLHSPPPWTKEGWLWIKSSRPGDVWSSYYCLANEHNFEWFKRGVKQVLSLENVQDIKTKVLPKGKLTARASAFLTTKKQAATTINSIHLQSLKDYCYKITLSMNAKIPYKEKFMGKFTFMVDSEERMAKWISAVRAQMGKSPRIGKKHFEIPLGETKTFRSTVAMRAPKSTPIKIQSALTTPETGKAWLHNFIRDIIERGDAEMGKTPLGNFRVDAPTPKDGKYRIITFDGGGLRSVVSIIILERLVEVFPDLLERVNLFCGTSGGAILATSLALGRSPTWIKTIMMTFGKYIFTRKARQFVTTARYDNNVLQLMGEEMFGNMILRDVPRSLIITAFQLDNRRVGEDFHSWIPRVIHNLPAAYPRVQSHFPPAKTKATSLSEKEQRDNKNMDRDARPSERLLSSVGLTAHAALNSSGKTATVSSLSTSPPSSMPVSLGPSHEEDHRGQGSPLDAAISSDDLANKEEEEPTNSFPVPTWPSEEDLSTTLKDLLLASSAAPTFFPTHKGFVDGGVFAHNPCMTAIASVISPEHANQQKLTQLEVLSLGTGRIAQYVEGEDLDWGIMQWARKLPDMIFGAAVWNAALLARMQLGKNFHRLDPILEKPIPMDDPTQLAEVMNVAAQIDLDDTIDWIREHFYGIDTKKEKKKRKPKLRPRRRNGPSQWWGQSQIFGEMFSSDEGSIHQTRKKGDKKKGRASWLKSKLAKPNSEADEEESYEEYIKHTITEDDDEISAPEDANASENDFEEDEQNDNSVFREGITAKSNTRASNPISLTLSSTDKSRDNENTTDLKMQYQSSLKRRASAPITAVSRPGNRKQLERAVAPSSGIDEAEEEEEEDLKTEDIDEKVYASSGDEEESSGTLILEPPSYHESDSYGASFLNDDEEPDTSDKEREALPDEEFVAEIEQDLFTLNQEIAHLEALKREREEKLQAILRRREREHKIRTKRTERTSTRTRREAYEQQKSNPTGGNLTADAKDRRERTSSYSDKKQKNSRKLAKSFPREASQESPFEHAVKDESESDDSDHIADEGKAKDCERDEPPSPEKRSFIRRTRGYSRDEAIKNENDSEEEDEEERGLVEVINSFLRREKKEKDKDNAGVSTIVSPRRLRRGEQQAKEKRKEKEKNDVLSPGARRKIFQSFSSTSFSSISSHLPSFAFHSSEKTEKQPDKIDRHQAVNNAADQEAERRKSPTPNVIEMKAEDGQLVSLNDGTDMIGMVSASFDDEEREKDRDKKSHSNIATFINKRILEMREHRRKRSATVPSLPRRDDADEGTAADEASGPQEEEVA